MNERFYDLITTDREKARLIHKIFKKQIKKHAKLMGWKVVNENRFQHEPKKKFTASVKIIDKHFKTKLIGKAHCHPSDTFDKFIGMILAEYRLMKKIKNMKKNGLFK